MFFGEFEKHFFCQVITGDICSERKGDVISYQNQLESHPILLYPILLLGLGRSGS